MIIAKTNWSGPSSTRYVECKLVAGSDFDVFNFEAWPGGEGTETATVVHTFSSSGSTADVQCRLTASGTVDLYNTKITAIGVDTLVNTAG